MGSIVIADWTKPEERLLATFQGKTIRLSEWVRVKEWQEQPSGPPVCVKSYWRKKRTQKRG